MTTDYAQPDSTVHPPRNDVVDVVIIGAGLSGIGAARRLQMHRPGTTFTLLETRERVGGTWDLFQYPGIRSDTDMVQFSYSFSPWRSSQSLADGPSIRDYIRRTADEGDVGQHIQFNSKVVDADFNTGTATWTLTVQDPRNGEQRQLTCRFLYCCAGYYDYDEAHSPQFEGARDFTGQVIHPQFWPQDLDHAGKRIAVIGSGATAVTLVPALLKDDPDAGRGAAAQVTMVQRTPTWISSVPGTDKVAERISQKLPDKVAHRVIRARKILLHTAFVEYCRRFPDRARTLLLKGSTAALKDPAIVQEHFTPTYNPWDQRLCAAPDGDFYQAIRSGGAQVVTGTIDRLVPEGIRMTSGEVVEADIIVTATGLKLQAVGGIPLKVDNEPVDLCGRVAWNGAMISGVPNFAMCVGYTVAPWTLRADLMHRLVCKVLNWMDSHGYRAVAPVTPTLAERKPLLDLSSTYMLRAASQFPGQGDRRPWRVPQNYPLDSMFVLRTNLDATLKQVTPARTPEPVGAEHA